MSWSYLPEPAAESTEPCCSDTLPFVPSRLLQRTGNCCCSDSATESCRASRYGMMCEHSTGVRGAELSTSFQEDSPAQTSAQPEKALESTERTADYGEKWRASFARFDRATSSWKTAQCSLFEGLGESSVIWPRSGMTVDGLAYPLPTAARRTSVIESGFWPTPNAVLLASDLSLQCSGDGRKKPNKLGWAVAQTIPTPRANDAEKRGNIDAENPRNGLAGFVRGDTVSGLLNPTFVEWLMGWPIGSTAFSPLAMDKFHEFMRQHGGS